HVHYVDSSGGVQVQQAHLPERAIDRNNSLAVGLRAGSLLSGYGQDGRYSDVGAGIAARYRPAETIGLEVALQHHDQSWTSESLRSQTMGSASVELFAWPWTRVSPYAIGGLTYTSRSMADEVRTFDGVQNIDAGSPLVGPHAGLGLELALGKSVALDL